MRFHRLSLLFLFYISASVILFWNLGKVPLFDPDEGRYSEMALHMVQSGDWMTPRMNGVVHVHKPPLSNWFVALSIQAFGVNEFATRLPSVVLSLLLFAVFIRLGKSLFDFETGYRSAWILLTSVLYLVVSRLVTTDMALTFFTFTSMSCFAFVFFGGSRQTLFFYLAVFFLGLGMLTKGPVSWMLVLCPLAVFMIWKKRFFPISKMHFILGVILLIGISISWFLTFMLLNEGAWDYFIHYQLLGRIFHGTAGRPHPIVYYLVLVPLTFVPWSVMMPSALHWLHRRIPKSDDDRAKLDFLICWIFVPFILFSLFRTKLATYIVPVFPPMAFLAGIFWTHFLRSPEEVPSSLKISLRIFSFIYLPLLVGGIAFILIRPKFVHGIPVHDLALLGALLIAASCVLIFLISRKKYSALFNTQVVSMLLIAWIALDALPAIRFKNSKIFAEKIMQSKKPGDKVLMFKSYFASLPFYLRERIIEVFTNAETAFEKEEVLKDFIYPMPESIKGFIESSGRVFILTNLSGQRDIHYHTQHPLHVLHSEGKILLLSNQAD